MSSYDYEPIPGLPGKLPPGERVLWRGSPDWTAMARRTFHTRVIGLYFLILICWKFASQVYAGIPLVESLIGTFLVILISTIGLAILTGFAWLYSRTTIYTITNSRIVMRFGVALPMMINIPLVRIEKADLKTYHNGTGDIPVTINDRDKFGYLHLWPNVRPWQFNPVQPMIRNIKNSEKVANILVEALSSVHERQQDQQHNQLDQKVEKEVSGTSGQLRSLETAA